MPDTPNMRLCDCASNLCESTSLHDIVATTLSACNYTALLEAGLTLQGAACHHDHPQRQVLFRLRWRACPDRCSPAWVPPVHPVLAQQQV